MKKLLGPACFAALLALFAAGCATTEVEEPIPAGTIVQVLRIEGVKIIVRVKDSAVES